MKKLFIVILLVCAIVAGAVTILDIQNRKDEPAVPVASAQPAVSAESDDTESATGAEEESIQDFPEQRAAAEKLAAELQAIENKDDMMKRFFELREEYCADPGKETYPDGYYFLEGQMVPVFENTVKALGDYEVSDPVQSDYGYHVIVKLPFDPDQTVTYSEDGTALSARALFANDAYGMLLDEYVNKSELVIEDCVKDLSILDYVVTTENADSASETGSGEEKARSSEELDYDALYASHSPEEHVMTVNGREVTWEEYYFWLKNMADTANYYIMMYSYYGMDVKWADYAETVTTSAQEQIRSLAAVEKMAEENGVALSEEDRQQNQEELEAAVEAEYGEANEENINAFLKEQGLTKELYDRITANNMLYSKGMTEIYGEAGAKIPDEDALGYLKENGYMHAAHILISTTDLLGN